MTAEPCPDCRGRGSRVIAAISDPHWKRDANGARVLVRTYAIPVVVPCICTLRKAAMGVPADG